MIIENKSCGKRREDEKVKIRKWRESKIIANIQVSHDSHMPQSFNKEIKLEFKINFKSSS